MVTMFANFASENRRSGRGRRWLSRGSLLFKTFGELVALFQ